MRVAGDADDDVCRPCVDAIKSQKKGCKRALKNKFYKIEPMPEECSGKLNPKAPNNCRVKKAKKHDFDFFAILKYR